MEDKKQTKSANSERTGGFEFKSSCCDFENMSQMMNKFLRREEGISDCCAMMQRMCGMRPMDAGQKEADQPE